MFPVLEQLEKIIDYKLYRNSYQQRVFGFLAERLLNVYIEEHKLTFTECPIGGFSGNQIPADSAVTDSHANVALRVNPKWKPVIDGVDYSKVEYCAF